MTTADVRLFDTIIAAAVSADLKPRLARETIRQVHEAVAARPEHAAQAGVSPAWISQIQPNLRLDLGN